MDYIRGETILRNQRLAKIIDGIKSFGMLRALNSMKECHGRFLPAK
jgi:hypothetical protein